MKVEKAMMSPLTMAVRSRPRLRVVRSIYIDAQGCVGSVRIVEKLQYARRGYNFTHLRYLVSQFVDFSYGHNDHISLHQKTVLTSLVSSPLFPKRLARCNRSDNCNVANLHNFFKLVIGIALSGPRCALCCQITSLESTKTVS